MSSSSGNSTSSGPGGVAASLRSSLVALPQPATQTEQTLAALLARACDELDAAARRAESQRKKTETSLARIAALINSECETLLGTKPQSGQAVASAAPASSPSAAPLLHSTHASSLSRRVSFNRDVLCVISPEIGHGDAAPARVDEEDDSANGGGSSSSSSSGGASALGRGAALSQERQRRLSRTEFGEGAILKQHLPLETLEKEEIAVKH